LTKPVLGLTLLTMNIFFLDSNPTQSAQYHVDRHVVKIITEANQCLASAYPKGVAPYKWAYHNHPMTKWVRESKSNFDYVVKYCLELCKEYTYRYGKTHKGEGIANWYLNNPPQILDKGFTEPPRCFGPLKNSIKITNSVVDDYRRYYCMGKNHLFSWKGRAKPSFLT